MKRIIAIICTVACMGLLFGCACDTKKAEETTTQIGSVNNESTNGTTVKQTPKETNVMTAAPTPKPTKKSENKNSAKKTKTKGGDIVGSWTWEGGIFVYNFNKDGSGVYTTGSDALYFTYTTNNNKVTIKYKNDGSKVTMPYTVKGKTLILKDSNNDDVIYNKNNPKKNPNK